MDIDDGRKWKGSLSLRSRLELLRLPFREATFAFVDASSSCLLTFNLLHNPLMLFLSCQEKIHDRVQDY